MKKIITVLCAAVMALSLFAGCGQKADDNNTAAAGGTVSTDGSTSMEKVIGAHRPDQPAIVPYQY